MLYASGLRAVAYLGFHKGGLQPTSPSPLPSDVNKDLTFKDKDQTLKAKDQDKDQTFKAKDQTPKDKDQDKDQTLKAKDQDKDQTPKDKDQTFKAKTRTRTRSIVINTE